MQNDLLGDNTSVNLLFVKGAFDEYSFITSEHLIFLCKYDKQISMQIIYPLGICASVERFCNFVTAI